MNKPVTIAMLGTGIVPKDVLAEMQRWGFPVKFIEVPTTMLHTPDQVVDCIRQAVEGDDTIQLRDTDLDVLAHYLHDLRQGKLYIFDPETDEVVVSAVTYSVLPNGRYVIPWTDESISDLLTYPKSYLKTPQGKVRFDDVEELFFGGVKAFVSARTSQAAP